MHKVLDCGQVPILESRFGQARTVWGGQDSTVNNGSLGPYDSKILTDVERLLYLLNIWPLDDGLLDEGVKESLMHYLEGRVEVLRLRESHYVLKILLRSKGTDPKSNIIGRKAIKVYFDISLRRITDFKFWVEKDIEGSLIYSTYMWEELIRVLRYWEFDPEILELKKALIGYGKLCLKFNANCLVRSRRIRAKIYP
jgi:hypothetical protein